MPYDAAITRNEPTAFLFLLDQSGSMQDTLPSGSSKAAQLADVLNSTITNLIQRCTKANGVRDYFQIGAIGYGSNVNNVFKGSLSGKILNPISEFMQNTLRVEQRTRKSNDGAGSSEKVPFPVWYEPFAFGPTPMRGALIEAAREISAFCDAHPSSYPPTILHITDGEASDGDPEDVARTMMDLHTDNGELLLFTLHLSDGAPDAIEFPDTEAGLPNDYAKMLFRSSSKLPAHLKSAAAEKGFRITDGSRGFMFNADASQIVDFFDIGTRAAQMR